MVEKIRKIKRAIPSSKPDKRKKIQYRSKPKEHTKLAEDMIKGLFRQAEAIFGSDKTQADIYVKMALKVSRKYKLKIPSEIKRKFCKHCHVFFRQGVNCRVRTREKTITYSCLECKKFMRFPHKKVR